MINPVTGWFVVTQCDNKHVISITNLVDTTWFSRCLRPTEIMYDQVLEFIGHDIRKYLIEEEYGILSKQSTSINPTSNEILERIHGVLGNVVQTYNIKDTYIYEYNLWSAILAVTVFKMISTANMLKVIVQSNSYLAILFYLENKQWIGN